MVCKGGAGGGTYKKKLGTQKNRYMIRIGRDDPDLLHSERLIMSLLKKWKGMSENHMTV